MEIDFLQKFPMSLIYRAEVSSTTWQLHVLEALKLHNILCTDSPPLFFT